MDADTANSGNLQQNVDEGLIIAKDTLQRLNSALQTLEEVEARNKMLEKSVISSVHEEFDKLLVALKNRKSVLLNKIKAMNEISAVELRNAIKDIMKQKECLQTRVAFAEGVLQSPLVTVYYDLSPITAELKMKIQNEGALDALNSSPDISFNIDLDQTLETINNLGMVCRAGDAACQNTSDTNGTVMKSPCVDLTVEDGNTKGQLKDCAKATYGFLKPKKRKKNTGKYFHKSPLGESGAILQKSNAVLQAPSSPDVIIEEIIEDDQPCVLLENKLSVELFDEAPSAVTSVNTVLVEGNVASVMSGPSDSGDHALPIKEVWDPVLDLSSDSVEEDMDNFSLSDRQELDVFVSHVVSPSRIYVRWLSTENILQSLQASLCDRYEKSLPEAVAWQVDMQVAVQTQSDEKWMRGKVRNISDNVVQVFCYDFGLLEVTEVSNLRTLDKSLMEYATMCLECSLMDIQPAGGCQNWTATACDYVSHYLTGAIATMVIEGNASFWPLPVKILIKNEAGKKVDVSESLVSKGLALRDRRLKTHKSPLKMNEKSTSMSAESGLQKPDPEEDLASDSQPVSAKSATREQSNAAVPEKPAKKLKVDEPYLPPLLPEEKTFSAKVSHVGDDGTIYVIQECLENERGMLMIEIQNSFKCLGLMAPYTWKKGEGCLIKGSDTMSYRGTVLDIHGGDMITVQYEDFGFTEKILRCHLYPSVYAPNIPGFCIPCQLIDILPIGDHWQPDAIQFLRELLKERLVTVHIVEPPKDTHDIASVRVYCGYASVSAILKVYNYGIPKVCEKSNIETACIVRIPSEKIWQLDCEELLRNDMTTPWLPKYSPTPLPRLGEMFEVNITHFSTPNKVSICIKNVSGDDDPLKSILKEINSDGGTLPEITDFRTAMPCLARYNDGLLHRAKLQSIKSYDPVTCLVEFVDFGTPKVLKIRSIFQLPPSLIQYPAKAIKVRLAGFKPPKEDGESCRIPYCPEWSVKALYEMMDLVQGRKLFATCIAGSKNTVFLYNDSQHLVHKPLIDLRLADIEEM